LLSEKADSRRSVVYWRSKNYKDEGRIKKALFDVRGLMFDVKP